MMGVLSGMLAPMGRTRFVAASGGGGAAAWHDVLELASSTSPGPVDVLLAHAITLPAGSFSKWRIGIQYGFSAGSCKVALYDGAKNLVTGTSATIAVPAVDNNVIEQAITPVALGAGSYWAALFCNTNQVYFGQIGGQPATDLADFGALYSAFPPASIASVGSGLTLRSAAGLYL